MKRNRTALRIREASSKLIALTARHRVLQLVVPVAAVAFVFIQGRKEWHNIDWNAALQAVRQIKPSSLLLLTLFAMASVAVIGGYDIIVRRHFRLPVGKWATLRYAWIANTTNSVIGFAGIAGVGLRTVLYRRRGIPPQTIAASIAYLSAITITGLSAMAWGVVIGALPAGELLHAHPWTRFVIWGDALFLPAFVLLQRTHLLSRWFNRGRGRMDWGTIAVSTAVSLLEWVMAGLTFFLIVRHVSLDLGILQTLGIFTVAAVTGLVSMAPGGIGGFDLTALLGLRLAGFDTARATAALVLFRLLYYIVPWIVGLAMAAFEFAPVRAKPDEEPAAARTMGSALNPWQNFWHRPDAALWSREIGSWSLGKLVMAGGFVLLISAAMPRLIDRLRIADDYVSVPVMRLSHQLSIGIGLVLIVLSWGIAHQVRRTYWWTLALLTAGALFTFTKAFDYEEAAFLFAVGLLLWLSRRRFDRMAAPFSRNHAMAWALITLGLTTLYFLIGAGTYPGSSQAAGAPWLLNPIQHAVSAVIGLAAAWLVMLLILFFRPVRRFETGSATFKAMNGRVSIVYGRDRDKLVVLGPPAGDPDLIEGAMAEFRKFADQYSLAIEYEASENAKNRPKV